jgi:hypothetical protein
VPTSAHGAPEGGAPPPPEVAGPMEFLVKQPMEELPPRGCAAYGGDAPGDSGSAAHGGVAPRGGASRVIGAPIVGAPSALLGEVLSHRYDS